MLLKINKVLTANTSKKPYGKTVLGKVMFPTAGVELKEGNWAWATPTFQTKRKPGAGETPEADGFITIPENERPLRNMVQAVFPTKEEAIASVVEEQSGDSDLVTAMKEFATDFTMADLKRLEGAAI